MLQIEVEGFYLDLYETEPPLLTISIEDLRTTENTTTYSKTFRVPATPNNNQFFKTAYEINGYDFNIVEVKTARLLINGVLFEEGELRLIRVYYDNSGGIDYECLFLGNKKTISSKLGDKKMCDLDSRGVAGQLPVPAPNLFHNYTYANIETSWTAAPEGSTFQGLANGNVLYPLVDFGNNYDEDEILLDTRIDAGSSNKTFANPTEPLNYNRFKPAIKVRWLLDKIFDNLGFTYESNFLSGIEFRQLYMSAWGNEPTNTLSDVVNSNTGYIQNTSTWVPLFNEDFGQWHYDEFVGENPDNFTFGNTYYQGSYEASQAGSYTFKYYIQQKYTLLNATNIIITIRMIKQSGLTQTLLDSQVITITPGQYGEVFSYFNEITTTLLQGDLVFPQIRVQAQSPNYYQVGSGVLEGSYFQAKSAPGLVSPTKFLSCELKQIDFIKYILDKFRLLIIPDKLRSNHFKIEPFDTYIGSGSIEDWTNKLDRSKDVIVEPLFFSQTKSIQFTDAEGNDFLSEDYQDINSRVYGELIVEDTNELLIDERSITTEITPLKINQLESSTNNSTRGFNFTSIPQIHKHEPRGAGGVKHIPIVPKPHIFFYNGLQDTGTDGNTTKLYYIQDENNSTIPKNQFPMISNKSEIPTTDTTLDLNWNLEDPQLTFDNIEWENGGSVYDAYWKDYIDLIYNAFTKKLTGYFYLDEETMRTFTFNKVIFIEGSYYYVEKIYDYSPQVDTTTKVDLIRLNNYKPTEFEPIPPGIIWDNQTDLWNTTTTTWDD